MKTVYNPTDIPSYMLDDYGVTLTYMLACRSNTKALELVRGNPDVSYEKFPSYFYTLKETYSSLYVKLHKSEDGHFLYVFGELNASIKV